MVNPIINHPQYIESSHWDDTPMTGMMFSMTPRVYGIGLAPHGTPCSTFLERPFPYCIRIMLIIAKGLPIDHWFAYYPTL